MGLLDGKVSQDDIERRHDMVHHAQFEDGFGDDSLGGDSGLDGFFDDNSSFDMNDLFGDDSGSDGFGGGNAFGQNSNGFGQNNSSSSDPFGSNSFGGNSFGNNSFGSNNGFGNNGFGNNGFGNNGFGNNGFGNNGFGNNGFGNNGFGNNGLGNNGFGNNGFGNNGFGNNGFGNNGFGNNGFGGQNINNGMNQQDKPDMLDKVMTTGADTAKNVGLILLDLFKSLKERNADDFGYLSRNIILCGVISIPAGILLGIIGIITKIRFLGFTGISTQISLCGALALTTGITGMGVSALVLTKIGENNEGGLNDIPDVPPSEDNFTKEYEDNAGDEFDDLFGDDIDSLFNDLSDKDDISAQPEEPESDDIFTTNVDDLTTKIDWDSELENIEENKYISRETLFNTFKPMFPICTPSFSEVKHISEDSKDFATLETICLKALSNIANCEMEEVRSNLVSADETFFSYTLLLKRFNKVKNCDALASEIEIYLREDSDDDSINATVSLEGDNYKIIVTKGVTAIVSFGDVFKQQSVCDYYLDKKHMLPIITGIDELGRVIAEDAKVFDTMMICGKPRSGKSWYVLSILMSMMLFNSPEDVQFIIIDPKKSNLFKTLALMPHVCGLHDDTMTLSILDEIIEVEAARRKQILNDHRCDDIWALREQGVMMPVLYLVIDEYITVKNNLEPEKQKELNIKIQTLMSQLPSQGIRLIFIPHRSVGIVDKTNRGMLQFTAAVRADIEDVNDALGIKSWKRSLTRPGDIAVKSSSMKSASYVRGAAVTSDDAQNTKFIETAAKVFYKMGVDIPDMSALKLSCNRDENYVQSELGTSSKRIQYDASSILKDIENMNFNDI